MYPFGCDRGMFLEVVTRGSGEVRLLFRTASEAARAFVVIEIHMRRSKVKTRTIVPERAAWGTKRFRAVSSNLNS